MATDLGSSESSLELVVLMSLLFFSICAADCREMESAMDYSEKNLRPRKKKMLGLLLERENEKEVLEVLLFVGSVSIFICILEFRRKPSKFKFDQIPKLNLDLFNVSIN